MSVYTLEPRDAAVFRDGRPVPTGASTMRTLAFPWPSTIAGLARTRAGSDREGRFVGDPEKLKKEVCVRGPWLARLGADDAPELLFPAPRDLVWFHDEARGLAPSARLLRRLAPLPRDRLTGVEHDLDDRLGVVGFVGADPPSGKPADGPPFWAWGEMARWLGDPTERQVSDASALGAPPLERERRVHVAIEPDRQTAEEGALFASEGLRFVDPARQRFALAFDSSHPSLTEHGGVVSLGGERRTTFLRAARAALPACPPAVERAEGRVRRVVLTTPAIFKDGAVPRQIRGAQVTAAVVGRPDIISGWDFASGRPKPTRRMAPAGSVYWVMVPEEQSVEAWCRRVFMESISDDEQDQRDGFGVALVGVA